MKLLVFLLFAGMASTGMSHKYINMRHDVIDSEEHGVTPGSRSTSCNCGRANRATGRIVGGQETGINQFPFAAGLTTKDSLYIFCGGTIISEYHVLTATHCTMDKTPDDFAVVVGEHNIKLGKETDATEIIDVNTITEHDNFNQGGNMNDIALIELKTKIKFSDKVGPACLPSQRNAFNLIDKYVKVMGWGDDQWGLSSAWLRHTNIRVVPLAICKRYFKSSVSIDEPKQLCTYSRNRDSCQGDSGGPVVYLDPDTNRYTLVGVVSFGAECGSITPGVNTEVAAYLDWIQNSILSTNPTGKSCTKV